MRNWAIPFICLHQNYGRFAVRVLDELNSPINWALKTHLSYSCYHLGYASMDWPFNQRVSGNWDILFLKWAEDGPEWSRNGKVTPTAHLIGALIPGWKMSASTTNGHDEKTKNIPKLCANNACTTIQNSFLKWCFFHFIIVCFKCLNEKCFVAQACKMQLI